MANNQYVRFFLISLGLFLLFKNCKNPGENSDDSINSDTAQLGLNKFYVDTNLSKLDTFKAMTTMPESKIYKNEKMKSPSRTSTVTQQLKTSSGASGGGIFYFENYICEASMRGETLDVFINNNNSYYGNGILIQVNSPYFQIKNIDPNTLNNELKFLNSNGSYQFLTLDKTRYKINDSIYGFIDYKTTLETGIGKEMKGYFRTIIK